MAELFVPKSPRPTRAQIDAVFGADPDLARKVERLFDDLLKAAEAANANAAELESIQVTRPAYPSALVAVVAVLEQRIEDLEVQLLDAERRARAVDVLAQQFNELKDYVVAS